MRMGWGHLPGWESTCGSYVFRADQRGLEAWHVNTFEKGTQLPRAVRFRISRGNTCLLPQVPPPTFLLPLAGLGHAVSCLWNSPVVPSLKFPFFWPFPSLNCPSPHPVISEFVLQINSFIHSQLHCGLDIKSWTSLLVKCTNVYTVIRSDFSSQKLSSIWAVLLWNGNP